MNETPAKQTSPRVKIGARVKVKEDAFGASDEADDIAARGQIGMIEDWIDSGENEGTDLWLWRSETNPYLTAYPYTGELEVMDNETSA